MRSRRGDEGKFSSRPAAWAWLGIAVGIGIASSLPHRTAAQDAVNPGAAVTQDLENRVAGYIKLRKSIIIRI